MSTCARAARRRSSLEQAPTPEFVQGETLPVVPDSVLATVLFTDLVGSTERATAVGDRRWREMLEEHHRVVRRDLNLYRGVEIDTAGDEFFCRFDGPGRAIACARVCARELVGAPAAPSSEVVGEVRKRIAEEVGGVEKVARVIESLLSRSNYLVAWFNPALHRPDQRKIAMGATIAAGGRMTLPPNSFIAFNSRSASRRAARGRPPRPITSSRLHVSRGPSFRSIVA